MAKTPLSLTEHWIRQFIPTEQWLNLRENHTGVVVRVSNFHHDCALILAVFESILVNLLNKHLSPFFYDFDTKQISLGVWNVSVVGGVWFNFQGPCAI